MRPYKPCALQVSESQGITSITFYAVGVLKALFVGKTDYEDEREHMAQSGFVHN